MRPVSCMVFLKNYIETNHPNIKITKSMINKGLKLEKSLIKINTPYLQKKKNGKAILISCNPRVGGTVISHILGKLTGWPQIQADLSNIDFNSIDETIIIHGHFKYEDYVSYGIGIPHSTLTIKRNPLDTLASAFVFAQQAYYNAQWHNREIFDRPVSKGQSIKSPQFYKWATSNNSSRLFKYTRSWLKNAEAIISYEDFKSDPVQALLPALRAIDPEKKYTEKHILNVVRDVDKNFLVNSQNKHRWKGESDYLLRMLPKDKYEAIRNSHKKDMEVLGYWE